MAQFNQLNLSIPVPPTDGGTGVSGLVTNKILVGAGTAPMVPTDVNAGAGITINKTTPGTWIISSSPVSVNEWLVVSGTSQAMSEGMGYIPDNVAQVVFTLPTTAMVGARMEIAGYGAGGWRIDCDVGQQIILGNISSSLGGSMSSTLPSDYVELLCIVADTVFKVLSSQGSPDLI